MSIYYIDDYDYDPPAQRRHCTECGGFLSAKETGAGEVYHVVVDVVAFRDVDTGRIEYHQDRRALTADELAAGAKAEWMEGGEPYWTCARCGHVHGVEEMYDY